VRDLAGVVKAQGDQIMAQNNRVENQIQSLTVAVTNANAPRKTDWNLLISLGFLILAFSGILFLPLNQTTQATKDSLHELTTEFHSHQNLELHPVGKAMLARLQGQLDASVTAINHDNEVQNQVWEKRFMMHDDMDRNEFKSLDEKLQKEFALTTETIKQKQAELEKELGMVNDKMCNRVTAIEGRMRFQDESDFTELRQWRNKANGLSSPEMSVPLKSRSEEKPVSK
jgi:predicted transcriptional regulator